MYKNEKEKFLELIDKCIKEKKGLVIEIENPKHPKVETIINPLENLNYKKEFYNESYTEDLEHKHCLDIKILKYYSI